MPIPQREPRSWFLLAGILAVVHTAIFLLLTAAIALSDDSMAGMAYGVFYFLDAPIARLYQLPAYSSPAAMLVFGGLLWFCCGFIVQSLFSIRHVTGILRLAAGVAVLCYLCLLPELSLKAMPGWKEQWERGRTGSETDVQTKISHVAEAVRLAPKDEPSLAGMLDYLGRLYMNDKQYERAEQAFKDSLAAAPNGPNPPSQTLGVYNNLVILYERTEDIEKRKECLHKAIESNRILYRGDSTQEAGCWHRLAEIANAAGNSAEAQELLERAIEMEARVDSGHDFSLNYMKEQLAKWKSASAGGGTAP